jgi:predicted DNA binding protein
MRVYYGKLEHRKKLREMLVTSFREGYYDIPRSIEPRELAVKLRLKSSALIENRIKTERRLLTTILKE